MINFENKKDDIMISVVLILFGILFVMGLTADKLSEGNETTEIMSEIETEEHIEKVEATIFVYIDTRSKYSLFGNDYMGHITKSDYEKFINGTLDGPLIISNGFGDKTIPVNDIYSIEIK